jgi:hypothetical protein
MKSLLFTAILSLRKRSEQLLIKFAMLLQIGLTHAQTFFRGVRAYSYTVFRQPTEPSVDRYHVLIRQLFLTNITVKCLKCRRSLTEFCNMFHTTSVYCQATFGFANFLTETATLQGNCFFPST